MSQFHRSKDWQRVTRVMRPILAAALPLPCIDCGRPVLPGQRWQVGHVIPVAQALAMGWTTFEINDRSNLGPTHTKGPGQKACNQIAGGKLGAAVTNRVRRDDRRFPKW